MTSLWRDPVARLTLVMSSIFCAWGMASPFLPRWLAVERGLTGSEIGVVLSAAMLARIVAGPALAAWAEGFSDRRTPVRILATAGVISWALFFYAGEGFWLLFALGFVAQTIGQALGPMVEGAALRAGVEGRIPFGVARAAGSAAFILGNVGGGAAVAAVGLGATPVWVLASLTLAALASWFALSPDPAPEIAPGFRRRLRAGLAYVRAPKVLLLLFGCACIQAGHAFYYGFSALVWRGQEISATAVGLLWGFAVSVEVIFLLMLPRIERSLKPEMLILIGAGAGVVRWSILAFAPVGFLLWPLQILHALTFAPAHVGALRVIVRDAPADMAMFTQMIYSALQAGVFMGLATLASGWLYDHVGAGGYWLSAALAAAGFALIWKLWTTVSAAGAGGP